MKTKLFITTIILLLPLALLAPLLGRADSQVQLNEVAWAGSEASSADEYIELKGPLGQDLTGWRLEAMDGTPGITLTGVISVTGFYLLERTDDNSVASIPAEQIYTGSLEDGGESLKLYDDQGNLVDELDATEDWPAGDISPNRAAMERQPDGTFTTNDCNNTSGALDAGGNTICGTPGAANLEPQPVSTVKFVDTPGLVAPGGTQPFVAQAWNSSGQAPEGSTMRFSLVSSGTIISIAPLTATINASGTATVQVTGITTGTAVIVAQWFGNLGGAEVTVVYPSSSTGDNSIYLPLIVKEEGSMALLPSQQLEEGFGLGKSVALVGGLGLMGQ